MPLITQLSGKPLLLIHLFYVNSLSVPLYVLEGPTVVLMTQSGTVSTTPGGKMTGTFIYGIPSVTAISLHIAAP